MATCFELYGYRADWDTGICTHCGKRLSAEEQTVAVNHNVQFGWDGYMHQWCFDFKHLVFMSAQELKDKWYSSHPELWDE